MSKEFVTPQEAIQRLTKQHYPGKKQGNARRVRLAFIGAMRTGQIEWRAKRWKEIYTSELGAIYRETFDELEGPKYGWPADFWTPVLAVDADAWSANLFISYGTKTLYDAPYKVSLWLRSNSETSADWMRCADDVVVRWNDVEALLSGPGWQAWLPQEHAARSQPLAHHYKAALIELIAIAVKSPSLSWTRTDVSDRLFDAFAINDTMPDRSDLERLAGWIYREIRPLEPGEFDAPME